MGQEVDTNFDVRSDAGGKDPDQHSATLRRYHQILWSKPLPKGVRFDLDVTTPFVYLHHNSTLGEFELSSDSIVHPYDYWVRTEDLIRQIPKVDSMTSTTSEARSAGTSSSRATRSPAARPSTWRADEAAKSKTELI